MLSILSYIIYMYLILIFATIKTSLKAEVFVVTKKNHEYDEIPTVTSDLSNQFFYRFLREDPTFPLLLKAASIRFEFLNRL